VSRPVVPDGVCVRVQVPATSANLGPAFDTAGLSLALYDEIEVSVGAGGCTVEVTGEGAGAVPLDESHLVLRALRAGLDHVGTAAPHLRLRAHNRVPHGRGLGSSAAATIAGLVVARELGRTAGAPRALDDLSLLTLAATFEGHADNVGAALLGGLVLVWTDAARNVQAVRLMPDPRVQPVLLVPKDTLSTARARDLLPESVPHRVATYSAGRAALLVTALTQRPDLLLVATDDRLHQPYRASAFPESMALVESIRARGVAAMISGAGPSVLVLTLSSDDAPTSPEAPAGWRRVVLEVDQHGARASVG